MSIFSDTYHGQVLTDFIDWCELSFLNINVLKTIRKRLLISERSLHWSVLFLVTHLFREFKLLPSVCRYKVPRCKTLRLKNSFIPATIGFINSNMWSLVALFKCCVACTLSALEFIYLLFLFSVGCAMNCPSGMIKFTLTLTLTFLLTKVTQHLCD